MSARAALSWATAPWVKRAAMPAKAKAVREIAEDLMVSTDNALECFRFPLDFPSTKTQVGVAVDSLQSQLS